MQINHRWTIQRYRDNIGKPDRQVTTQNNNNMSNMDSTNRTGDHDAQAIPVSYKISAVLPRLK
jgi:hypothetical protein